MSQFDITVEGGTSVRLPTAGKYCDRDIVVTAEGGGVDDYPFYGDGKTRLYIHLQEGRTSPRLNVSPNGTVTVDWGDGSAPDVLTGTSTTTLVSTPNHAYPTHGDYVITLTIDGTMGFGNSASSATTGWCLTNSGDTSASPSVHYMGAILAAEISDGVVAIGSGSFTNAMKLSKVHIADSVSKIGVGAFSNCRSLRDVVLPDTITGLDSQMFADCSSLRTINIPKSVASLRKKSFTNCISLENITLPNALITIGEEAFYSCYSMTSVVIPSSVMTVNPYAFYSCYGMAYYDFTALTAVPNLLNSNAFSNLPADCEIRVPAALVDDWKAATNWSTYADKIVGV